MGQRYRQHYAENADVLDPTFWVLDNNDLASEVNGSLDRDNVGEASIAQNEIVVGAFTTVGQLVSTTGYTPDRQTTAWQGADTSGAGANSLFQYNITVAYDCVLMVECVLEWSWSAVAWSMIAGAAPMISDSIQMRMTVDGIEVARTGYFSDMQDTYGTTMFGEPTVVTAGAHQVRVEVMCCRRQDGNYDQEGVNTNDVTFNTRALMVTQEKR